jgi:hypothetical protein
MLGSQQYDILGTLPFVLATAILILALSVWKEKKRWIIARELERQEAAEAEEERKREIALKEKYKKLKEKYKNLSVEEIIFNDEIDDIGDKIFLITEIHHYTEGEASELIETAEKEARKAKLKQAKVKISQKALELYGSIPADDTRKPISDEVKMFVWNRDGGKCVNCGSEENLEYDHIIPISKGGSNTARNIQILCEKCNRTKRDSIS